MGRFCITFLLISSFVVLASAACSPYMTRATAADISFPSTSNGVLCADPQYYRFTLASSASVAYEALFNPPVTSNAYGTAGDIVNPEVNFYDEAGNALFTHFVGCGRYSYCPWPNNGNVTLAAGTWSIEISRLAYSLPDGEYPFSLQLSTGAECAQDPLEPNDDSAPHPIALSASSLSANICGTGDVDAYTFTTGSLQTITFAFSPKDMISVRLVDARGTFFPIDASNTAIITAPGTYTLRVTADPRVPNFSSDYLIEWSVTTASCSEDAYEPNDDVATATAIALPFSSDLTRCHWNDEDWFKFDLVKPQVLTVSITGGADIGNEDLEIINPDLLRILPIARQDPLMSLFYLPQGSFMLRLPALRATGIFNKTFEYPTPVSYHLSLTTADFTCATNSFAPGFTNATAVTTPVNTALHVCEEFDSTSYSVADYFANQLWFKFTVTETSVITYYIAMDYYDRALYRMTGGTLQRFEPSELPVGDYVLRISVFGVAFQVAPNFDFKILLSKSTPTSTTGNSGTNTGSQATGGSYVPPTPAPTTPTTISPTTPPTMPTAVPTTVPPTTRPAIDLLPLTPAPERASQRTGSHAGIIIGAVLGGFALFAAAAIAGTLLWRHSTGRQLLPFGSNEAGVVNNNPAYKAPAGPNQNPLHDV